MTTPINISSSQPAELVAAIEALSGDKPAIPFIFSSGDTDLIKLLLATASNYPDATKSEIPPASSPAAYALMHEVSRRFTDAICTSTSSNDLIPYLDSLPSVLGGQGGASKLVFSRNIVAPTHIGRGLFNLVIGKFKDLVKLQVESAGGSMQSVKDLLPSNASPSTIFGIMVPGLTLQLIDGRFKATNHKVIVASYRSKRDVVIFQWRLKPGFKVDLENILNHLPSFLVAPTLQTAPTANPALTSTPPRVESVDNNDPSLSMTVIIKSDSEDIVFRVLPTTQVGRVFEASCQKLQLERHNAYFEFDGMRIPSEQTFEEFGIEQGDIINLFEHRIGD